MLNDRPETRYVAVGDADVAYKVIGNGPLDLLLLFGADSQVDSLWDDCWLAQMLAGLAAFSRIIVFDRRGTGASDRVPRTGIPTWEEWTQDVSAVLDEVGSDRVAVIGAVDSGPIAVLFAATHPERVDALVLSNTTARYLVDDDYPFGASSATLDAVVETVRNLWGTSRYFELVAPANADDTEFLESGARRLRASATPASGAAQLRYILETLDVRGVLPTLHVPTLVLHTSHNPFIPLEHGRYLAEHIAGAKLVEVAGEGVTFDDDTVALVLGHVTEFLTGERPVPEVDRVLTTVLFTDIVSSTEQLITKGDVAWRRLLDHHDAIVRAELARVGGREIQHTGDGFLAVFDGPARAINCAGAIIQRATGAGILIRAGIHVGECERRGENLAGIAVHIGARVCALAQPEQILVTSTVRDLTAGSDISFTDHGIHTLKGVPDPRHLYQVN